MISIDRDLLSPDLMQRIRNLESEIAMTIVVGAGFAQIRMINIKGNIQIT